MEGKVKIQGDLTKLMAAQASGPAPVHPASRRQSRRSRSSSAPAGSSGDGGSATRHHSGPGSGLGQRLEARNRQGSTEPATSAPGRPSGCPYPLPGRAQSGPGRVAPSAGLRTPNYHLTATRCQTREKTNVCPAACHRGSERERDLRPLPRSYDPATGSWRRTGCDRAGSPVVSGNETRMVRRQLRAASSGQALHVGHRHQLRALAHDDRHQPTPSAPRSTAAGSVPMTLSLSTVELKSSGRHVTVNFWFSEDLRLHRRTACR